MKTLLLVGIGTGNPEHLTVQAINALNRADVLFIPDKGTAKADLADLRRDIIARYVSNPASRSMTYAVPKRDAAKGDYEAGVDEWHAALACQFAELTETIPENGAGAFLVWGDPGLYDSTLRIIERLPFRQSLAVEVIPGITAVQALTAAHAIPLNRIGEPVHITPGRKLSAVTEDTIVMLDGRTAFSGADPALEIFWGAYLGTPDQITISGRLGDVAEDILRTRREARERHGWIMDTYLLRKPEGQ